MSRLESLDGVERGMELQQYAIGQRDRERKSWIGLEIVEKEGVNTGYPSFKEIVSLGVFQLEMRTGAPLGKVMSIAVHYQKPGTRRSGLRCE